MGSTPSFRPSTTSFLLASMNATTCAAGGRAPPRRKPRTHKDLVGPAQLTDLLLERLDLLRLGRGDAPASNVVDVRLLDPTRGPTRPRSRAARRPGGPPRASSPSRPAARGTIRTAARFSSSEYRRVVGLPAVRS